MGLILNIYREAGADPGCEVSDKVDRITVVNVAGPIEPTDDAPAFVLEAHEQYRDFPLLRPVNVAAFKGQRGPMAGGNYAGSWDSWWHLAVAKITGHRSGGLVLIHDRFEVVD